MVVDLYDDLLYLEPFIRALSRSLPLLADLFPHDEVVLARTIGMAEVYVPSAQATRPLHEMTAAEVQEAANHMARQAANLNRTAANLGRLARIRRAA